MFCLFVALLHYRAPTRMACVLLKITPQPDKDARAGRANPRRFTTKGGEL